jgi:hypothetical protein
MRTPEQSDGSLGGNAGSDQEFLGRSRLEIPLSMTQVGDDIGLQLMWDSYAMQFPSFTAGWDDVQEALAM